MALVDATVASSNADSLVSIDKFNTYLSLARTDQVALIAETDEVKSAHLRAANNILQTLQCKGEVPRKHGMLFSQTTVTIANNTITFDSVPSFAALSIDTYELSGDPLFVNRNDTWVYNKISHWIKLVGTNNNDGFHYIYSINDFSIEVDREYSILTDEVSTANVDIWCEVYTYGMHSGFSQALNWPRRAYDLPRNELPHEIPVPFEIAQMELAIANYSGALISSSAMGTRNEDISAVDLAGAISIEFDKSEKSSADRPMSLSIPIPDHILMMLEPYLVILPGVTSYGSATKVMRS